MRRDDWWGTEVFGVTPAPEKVNFMHVGPETSVALSLSANEIDTPAIGILSPGAFLSVKERNPERPGLAGGCALCLVRPLPACAAVPA